MKRPQPKCFSTEKSKADFIHECEAWINLGLHPNIVSCYYVREINGTPSIFSEWMEGGSLESAINSGSLYAGTKAEQKERLLDIAIQFARGLHYAHEAGLIHQDVKPDNVLLSKEGEAKVADFGISRARTLLTILEGDPTMREPDSAKTTVSPSGAYTPAYCSMEQMDGKALTHRTDIYSWAVSLMEMYLSARPWANGVVAGLSCRSYFSETRIPIPSSLKDLLEHCLESEPKNRPHDFAEIEARLLEIYQTEASGAYPRPTPKAAADTADSFNNRALSYLDLGKPDEAERAWENALKTAPNHLDSLYNHGLYLWRLGKITDTALERKKSLRARLRFTTMNVSRRCCVRFGARRRWFIR
jgi:serine/threonine protein kinase